MGYKIYFFGSVETSLSSSTSDVDALVELKHERVNRAISDWVNWRSTENFKREPVQVLRKARVPLVTLQHNNGAKCDLTFATPQKPRNEVKLNAKLLRAFGFLGWHYRVAHVALKEMFMGAPVFQARDGGIPNYALAILMQAICVREGYLLRIDTEAG